MNLVGRSLLSLTVGLVAFALVATAATAGFGPWMESPRSVGVPVGLSAGATVLFVAFAGLRHRERAAEGAVDRSTARLRRAAAAALLVVLGAGVAAFFLVDGEAGVALLTAWLPATLVFAAVAGYLTAGVGADDPGARSSSG